MYVFGILPANVNDVHILESLIVYVVDEKNVKMNQNC